MSMFLNRRALQAEYFDSAERTPSEVAEGYAMLNHMNRLFVLTDPYRRFLPRLLGPERCRSLSFLDLGAGDGWLHGGGDLAELPDLLARLHARRRAAGTADRPFEIHVISTDAYHPDGVRRLEDQGVTDLIVGFRWPYHTGPDPEPLADKLTNLARFQNASAAMTKFVSAIDDMLTNMIEKL